MFEQNKGDLSTALDNSNTLLNIFVIYYFLWYKYNINLLIQALYLALILFS